MLGGELPHPQIIIRRVHEHNLLPIRRHRPIPARNLERLTLWRQTPRRTTLRVIFHKRVRRRIHLERRINKMPPIAMYAPSHAFVEYDAESGASRRLTPESQPFKIASGDWAVSPDGKKIVFVNAADNNLWVWEFTP